MTDHPVAGTAQGAVVAETPRLRLRRLCADDAAFVLRLVNEPAFRENIGDKNLRTLVDARRFLEEGAWTCQPREGYGQFLVEDRDTGAAVGVCGLLYRAERELSDVGFALVPEARGRGYAEEAARAVLDYARLELGVAEVSALVSPGNAASIRVLEKLGLQRVGDTDGPSGPTLIYASRR
ncbi:MAG: GNAT family N-acetyltransferase [Gammaproteobacteria bacterium]